MIKIAKGNTIGIATNPNLTDMECGNFRTDLTLDLKSKVRSFPHSDGADRWVFYIHNLYLVVSTRSIAA